MQDWEFGFDSFGPYPYEANAPGLGRVTIGSDADLWEIVAQLDEPGIEAPFVSAPSRLLTPWAVEQVNRYTYCQEMHVPAYAGAYDDQPALWVDVVAVIRAEREKASKYGRK